MGNNKLKLILKIACAVLCAAFIITGSVCISALVMQDDINALNAQLDGASNEITDIKGKYEAALQELDALASAHEQTKSDLDNLVEVHKNTTEELGKLSGEIDTLKQAMNASDEEIEALKGEYEAAKKQIDRLKAEIAALDGNDTRIRIYIDQGHNPTGYYNAGSAGNGYYEQDITFVIGKLLAELLEEDGRFVVCLSRPYSSTVLGDDNDSSLDARVDGAKEFGADYFISLHTNSYHDSAANGLEILTVQASGESYRFGDHLREYIIEATNIRDRGMKQKSNVRVLNNATMPAILIEMGFISNPDDAALMVNHPELFADGIYNGILSYFDFLEPAE